MKRYNIRMQEWIVTKIKKASKADGSNFSQFVRTACIEKLNKAKVAP